MRAHARGLMLVALGLIALSPPLWAAEPFAGSWKINPAKSKIESANVSADSTTTFDVTDAGFTITVKRGDRIVNQPRGTFDGKEHPVGAGTSGKTVLYTHPDSRTIVVTTKQADKVVSTLRHQVSADGKTLMTTFDGPDSNGKQVHNVIVYDKQ